MFGRAIYVRSVIKLVDVAEHQQLLEPMYEQIFRSSFRADELDPIETVLAVLNRRPSTKDVVAAVGEDDKLLGALVGDWFPHSRIYLLSYLAIRPGSRDRGIGGYLMRCLPRLSRRRGALLTVAEVDDPRVYTNSRTGDPVARLRFYGRCGGKVLDVPYVQPRVRPDGDRVRGMLLLAFDIQPEAWLTMSPPALEADVLSTFLSEYFDEAEGPGDDPERRKLEATASERSGIAVLPMAGYSEVPLVGPPGGMQAGGGPEREPSPRV